MTQSEWLMARRNYTPEQKAEALDLFVVHGAAETARMTGITAGTIAAWASRAGLTGEATAAVLAATKVAAARRTYVAEEFRTQMVEQLAEVARLAASKELERLRGSKASLHEIVGARTRAIHDLQLLSGDATNRTETTTRDNLDREIERLMDAHA